MKLFSDFFDSVLRYHYSLRFIVGFCGLLLRMRLWSGPIDGDLKQLFNGETDHIVDCDAEKELEVNLIKAETACVSTSVCGTYQHVM